MPVRVEPIDFAELAEELNARKNNNQKTVLFMGARTGALFRSSYLYEWLGQSSKLNFAAMSERARFSECYEILEKQNAEKGTSPRDMKSRLMSALYNINFSPYEDRLAELIQQGIFNVILYNNPDDLLYDACIASGMKEQHDFVDSPLERLPLEEMIPDMLDKIAYHDKLDACKLVRIYKDIDTFVYDLNRPQAQAQCSRQIKSLLAKLHVTEVLVVGLDPVWDAVFMSALPPRIRTIWFVNEDKAVMDKFLSSYEQVEQLRHIVGARGNYGTFVNGLYFHINQGVPHANELLYKTTNEQKVIQRDLAELKNRYDNLYKDIMHIKAMTTRILQLLEEDAHRL